MAFSKQAVEGILMWGFWAGSHWRGSNAAIVDLNWTLNEAGQRYQSLMTEWTTVTNETANGNGVFDFRGFHGNYDITLTPPGGEPTLRRLTLDPGAGTNVVLVTAHSTGIRPVLHNMGFVVADGPFRFQLTGDAGQAYAIQSATPAGSTNWTTLTNVLNPAGTIWITNNAAAGASERLFRARVQE
jgi:hypothetical protein